MEDVAGGAAQIPQRGDRDPEREVDLRTGRSGGGAAPASWTNGSSSSRRSRPASRTRSWGSGTSSASGTSTPISSISSRRAVADIASSPSRRPRGARCARPRIAVPAGTADEADARRALGAGDDRAHRGAQRFAGERAGARRAVMEGGAQRVQGGHVGRHTRQAARATALVTAAARARPPARAGRRGGRGRAAASAARTGPGGRCHHPIVVDLVGGEPGEAGVHVGSNATAAVVLPVWASTIHSADAAPARRGPPAG